MTTMRSAPGSRLPVRVQVQQQQPEPVSRGMSAPSKLEQLRQQYQQQLERAKAQKLQEMYFNNPPPSNRALIKLTNNNDDRSFGDHGYSPKDVEQRGKVRDMLKERRVNEDHRPSQPLRPTHNGYSSQYKNRQNAKPPLPNHNGVGRDKSKPLAPISRDNTSSPTGLGGTWTIDKEGNKVPFNRKAVIARGHKRNGSTGSITSQNGASDIEENHSERGVSKSPFRSPKIVHRDSRRNSAGNDKRKVKNFREWQEQMKLRTEHDQADGDVKQPNSDFQKWQQEQDEEKRQRLNRYNKHQKNEVNQEFKFSPSSNESSPRKKVPSPPVTEPSTHSKIQQRKAAILQKQRMKHIEIAVESSDDEDPGQKKDSELAEIHRQEAELRAQIERQRQELEDIRKQREREDYEEQERIKAEKKRRQQHAAKQKLLKDAEEKERRRREQEEETERRMEQEENEARLRKLERMNAQNQNVIQTASHRNSSRASSRTEQPTSNRTYSVSEHGDDKREETPPSKYFPTKPIRPISRQKRKDSIGKNNAVKKQPAPSPPEMESGRLREDPTSFYVAAANQAENEQLVLNPCSQCGRKFAEERLAKHTKACKESAAKLAKRKKFDPVKMRMQGTEAAQYANHADKKKPEKPKKSNWRTQHENFVKTIRYAKAVTEAEKTGGSVADLPPPPVTENPDYEQCPYCNRKFNQAAAERHIPRCKELKTRPKAFNTRKR